MSQILSFFLDISSFVILWIIVPVIMIGMVFSSRSIVKRTAKGQNKVGAEAGFWGGFILFIIYFIYKLPLFRISEISIDKIYPPNIFGTLIGLFIGLILLLILKKIISTKMIGFVTLLLNFCGMASTYSYFFIRTYNDILLPAFLGIAFAVVLYIIVSPKSLHDFFDQKI